MTLTDAVPPAAGPVEVACPRCDGPLAPVAGDTVAGDGRARRIVAVCGSCDRHCLVRTDVDHTTVEDVTDELGQALAVAGHPHGTRGSYIDGCRCPDCTRAGTLYQRTYRARRRDAIAARRRRQARKQAAPPTGIARLVAQVDQYLAAQGTRRGADGWVTRAACAGIDPNLFHPERGEATEPAKAVCRACPVREHCLVAALARGEKFGIWGGHSERERRPLRRAIAMHRREREAVA